MPCLTILLCCLLILSAGDKKLWLSTLKRVSKSGAQVGNFKDDESNETPNPLQVGRVLMAGAGSSKQSSRRHIAQHTLLQCNAVLCIADHTPCCLLQLSFQMYQTTYSYMST